MQTRLSCPNAWPTPAERSFPISPPLIREDDDGHWYLAEDFSFCERARQCGYKIMADTTIRLWHIGNYSYGWEDAGSGVKRFGTYRFRLTDREMKLKMQNAE